MPALPVVVPDLPQGSVAPFAERLERSGLDYRRRRIETVQVNLGKLCNQACKHCHVEAGPTKTRENMDRRGVDRVLELVHGAPGVQTVDVTGGAPELNPHFRHLVRSLVAGGRTVIDRSNLTVLLEEGQEETAEFLAEHRVSIVASLPCYSSDNVDRQRGRGVFDRSIEALRRLCAFGYGHRVSGLSLDLVYNPLGPSLPPEQEPLEADYRRQLRERYGIEFNRLWCITNMPIKRFLWDLQRSGRLEPYMRLLAESFNREAAERVMCLGLVSIGWDGQIYDCDFNQMLDIPAGTRGRTIFEIDSLAELEEQPIAVADHCYGCTAGCGSSCTGALT